MLTPLRADPPSAIPLAVVVARLLAAPGSAAALAASAVDAYAVGPDAIAAVSQS